MEEAEFVYNNDIKLCYAREFSDEKMIEVFKTGKDFITDLQNLTDKRLNLIERNGYKLRFKGYNMTGNCDLYQFYFTKIK